MERVFLRAMIRRKLADGRLPQNSISEVWGGPSTGETCDACDEEIGPNRFVMEAVSFDPTARPLQFHLACLYVWDEERTAPGR